MRPLLVVVILASGCFGPPDGLTPEPGAEGPDLSGLALAFDVALADLAAPVHVTHAGDGSGRLFVVEQEGRILAASGGAVHPAPFLDIRDRVLAGGERGLLAVAFPPDFRESGRFYVDYTRQPDGATVLARFRVAADGRGDAATEERLLVVEQPYANHNGGALAFGPDGFLYVGVGDGGAGGDPHGHGQDRTTLLGSLLRLDVRGAEGYAVPPDNPFVSAGGAGEVWAYGLRNPWRLAFDSATGAMFLGDVGQSTREEINYQAPSSGAGANYGWNVWEGTHRFRPGATDGEATFPVAEYARESGRCSVTGGEVYRGSAHPTLVGAYLYADYCSGEVWGLSARGGAWTSRVLATFDARITSFGTDEAGEVYAADHGGRVLRLRLAP